MPVIIRDFELVGEEPERPVPAPSTPASTSPAPAASASRLAQALRQLRERARRIHAD